MTPEVQLSIKQIRDAALGVYNYALTNKNMNVSTLAIGIYNETFSDKVSHENIKYDSKLISEICSAVAYQANLIYLIADRNLSA